MPRCFESWPKRDREAKTTNALRALEAFFRAGSDRAGHISQMFFDPTQPAKEIRTVRAFRCRLRLSGREVSSALYREFDVDQAARMIHVGLRHQQGEILALQRGKHFGQPLG